MKVYITKYALTKGIHEEDGEIENAGLSKTVKLFLPYGKPRYHGTYSWGFRLTRQEAEQQAEKMRLAKIKSLEKQLDKLRRLSFKEAPLKVEKK